MMSADSLAMSTALLTEMPTSAARSAGASLMPSPRKPTTWRQPREHRLHAGGVFERLVVERVDVGADQDLVGVESDLRADRPRDHVVVAGEHLDVDAVGLQRSDRLRRSLLGRIEKGDVAEQHQVILVLAGSIRFLRPVWK
jgi:hypothetical protein